MHGASRTILFTWHAVPAFVEFHVGLALDHVDGQHIERANVDADCAAFMGDAFICIDRDRYAGWTES